MERKKYSPAKGILVQLYKEILINLLTALLTGHLRSLMAFNTARSPALYLSYLHTMVPPSIFALQALKNVIFSQITSKECVTCISIPPFNIQLSLKKK